nr:MAG TPA: hypothetical protein [Caudoviricetes sp.]
MRRVTIKWEAHICCSSPHEAGGGTIIYCEKPQIDAAELWIDAV